MKVKILSLLLAFSLVFAMIPFTVTAESDIWDGSTANSFFIGDGSETNPYIIQTAAQLAYLAKCVNEEANSFKGKYIRLDADISLNDTSKENWTENANCWTPIGKVIESITSFDREGTEFRGTFDGNNHSISGIYIETNDFDIGLFGYIEEAVIKNLTVKDSVINVPNRKSFAGGIAAVVTNSKFENCISFATVNGKYSGGIAGTASRSKLDGCVNNGTITGTSAGGILGSAMSETVLSNCKNFGAINSDYSAGGIAGVCSIRSSIVACMNAGAVDGNYAGGISASIDYNFSSAKNCYNKGDVHGKSSAGGIDGTIHDGEGTIEKCYNVGKITCDTAENASAISPSIHSGYYNIIDCYYLEGTAKYGILYNNADNAKTPIENRKGVVTMLTDAEMQKKDSFAGFDFDKIWFFNSDSDYLYPELSYIEINTKTIIGDVDNDGEITADDYITLKRIFFGQAKLEALADSENALARCDINKSGAIDADDYILLKRVYFGMHNI